MTTPRTSSAKISGTHRIGGSECLLLIERDPAVRPALLRVLTTYGYRVITANGLVDALRILSERMKEIALVVVRCPEPQPPGETWTPSADPDVGRPVLLLEGSLRPQELAARIRTALDELEPPEVAVVADTG